MRNNFIEKSIVAAVSFLKEAAFSDEHALKDGFLQSIEARIKVITIILLLLSVLFTRNIAFLFLLYSFCISLVLFSKISLVFFLKRTWVFIPLFSLFVALPALFANFTPGEPLFSFKLFGVSLIITKSGFDTAALFVMRVATSVSFAVLLGLVTKHSVLLSVLRIFKVPQVFVMTTGMCYRYIYLFAKTVENTYLGIKSRVGAKVNYKKGQRMAAWNMASLWRRSVGLNEEVYNAMLSRGYTGEPFVLEEFKFTIKDWVWFLFTATIFILTLYLNHG